MVSLPGAIATSAVMSTGVLPAKSWARFAARRARRWWPGSGWRTRRRYRSAGQASPASKVISAQGEGHLVAALAITQIPGDGGDSDLAVGMAGAQHVRRLLAAIGHGSCGRIRPPRAMRAGAAFLPLNSVSRAMSTIAASPLGKRRGDAMPAPAAGDLVHAAVAAGNGLGEPRIRFTVGHVPDKRMPHDAIGTTHAGTDVNFVLAVNDRWSLGSSFARNAAIRRMVSGIETVMPTS